MDPEIDRIYHPRLNDEGQFSGGRRDSQGRLRLIQSIVDFRGKSVIDLGCQMGFFSLSIAQEAASVLAVDASEDAISECRARADRLGSRNIRFLCAPITAELLDDLPRADITLCLSVLHHIVAHSSTYDVNQHTKPEIPDLLRALQKLSNTLIFEMGEITEKADWVHPLRQLMPDQDAWIREHVFSDAYESVQELKGTNWQHPVFRSYPWLASPAKRWPYGRKLLRSLGLQWQDFRTIYVARRKSPKGVTS